MIKTRFKHWNWHGIIVYSVTVLLMFIALGYFNEQVRRYEQSKLTYDGKIEVRE